MGSTPKPPRVHLCQCPYCQNDAGHPLKEQHRQLNLFFSCLRTEQKRWFAAVLSDRIGRGGVQELSQITGLTGKTIGRGRAELAEAASSGSRLPSSGKPTGRPPVEIKQPGIEEALGALVEDETAGDPMTRQKWVRSSLRTLTRQLKDQGYSIGFCTVSRLLKKMGFSMKVSIKKKRGIIPESPKRDEQFRYIAEQKRTFLAAGYPVISVDAKKSELIGDFKRAGKVWCKEAPEVNEYDFRSLAVCRAVPYGIYDVAKNFGYVYVGTSAATPEFAADVIADWWKREAQTGYPAAQRLLILADGGGTNGWRSRVWKQQLQTKLSDQYGLTVTVCHYPPRCSKWNPIERRLFSFISINWAGKPLTTLESMLGYIRDTTTTTGLIVQAFLWEGHYAKGQKTSKREMEGLSLVSHETCADWNYTIQPRGAVHDG